MPPRKPALVFIFITLFLDVLGIGLVVPILPKLVESLAGEGVDHASYVYGWLVGLYALMQFLFAPVLGNLSDRFGRRPVILFSLFGSGLDYFLLAWAPTLPWFFIGRVISGITGANFSAAAAYIADVSPPERRAANFGIIGAAFGIGFIFGPALGGWLGDYGLRVPFIAAGILTLVNWLYGLFILPESLKPENRRSFSLRRSNPIGALLELRRHRLVLGLSVSYFISSLAHQVYPSIWVLYTGYRYGWDTKQTGLSLALVGLMAAIVQGGLAPHRLWACPGRLDRLSPHRFRLPLRTRRTRDPRHDLAHRRRQRTGRHPGLSDKPPKRRRCARAAPRHRGLRVFHQREGSGDRSRRPVLFQLRPGGDGWIPCRAEFQEESGGGDGSEYCAIRPPAARNFTNSRVRVIHCPR
jgi:multidrug resistance protein